MKLPSALRTLLPLAGLLTVLSSASATSLIHSYDLNGSFADSLGGPSIVGAGGSLGGSGYTFGANEGPNLSNALTGSTGNYSIEMLFSINDNSGYKKLIDFKDLSSDNGLYILNTRLNFYPVTPALPPIAANTPIHLIATRDSGTNLFTGYINGVTQFSFTDAGGFAVFSGTNNIIHFLHDDFVTGGSENPAGFLDQVRIYDGALSGAQVLNLYNGGGVGVPDSLGASWLLAIAAVIGFSRRRPS